MLDSWQDTKYCSSLPDDMKNLRIKLSTQAGLHLSIFAHSQNSWFFSSIMVFFGSACKLNVVALYLRQYFSVKKNSLLSRVTLTGRRSHFCYYTNIFVFPFTSWTTEIIINTNTSTSSEKNHLLLWINVSLPMQNHG